MRATPGVLGPGAGDRGGAEQAGSEPLDAPGACTPRDFIFFFNSGVPLSSLTCPHDLAGLPSLDSRYPGVLNRVKLFSNLVFLS